jgi:hypothetical protein
MSHGLGQIEGAVLALPGQPLKAAPDQEVQPLGEVVAPEKRAAIDLAGREISDLCDLFDQAIAFHDIAGDAQLFDRRYGHFPNQSAGME